MSEKTPHLPLPEQEIAHITGAAEQQAVENQVAGETAVRGLGRFFKRRKGAVPYDESIETTDVNLQNAPGEAVQDKPESEPRAESYAFLDEILSPAKLETEKARLQASIEADPLLSAFGSLYEANLSIDKAWYEANKAGDRERARQLDTEAAELRAQIKSYDTSVANSYIKHSNSINQIDKYSSYAVDTESEIGQTLIRTLQAASHPKEKDTSAPFAQYAENEIDSWRAVSSDEVLDYLSKKEFNQHVHPEEGMVIVNSAEGQPFEVPLDLITNASGFDDWQGRKSASKTWDSEYGEGKMASLDVIKHYAGLPTELPPVGEIRVMISPDGKIICDNGSGDSHRISAAILRGDTTIKANQLHFMRLTK